MNPFSFSEVIADSICDGDPVTALFIELIIHRIYRLYITFNIMPSRVI